PRHATTRSGPVPLSRKRTPGESRVPPATGVASTSVHHRAYVPTSRRTAKHASFSAGATGSSRQRDVVAIGYPSRSGDVAVPTRGGGPGGAETTAPGLAAAGAGPGPPHRAPHPGG